MTGTVASDDMSDTLPVGAAIGGYSVQKLLGQGGFGITYEAKNRVTGRSVAIKEFFPSALVRRDGASRLIFSQVNTETIEWALKKFEETTTTLCRLSHPNIVQVLDYVPANNTGYMIMELLEGRTLKGWLKSRDQVPTLDELRPLLEPVMEALTYVHREALVHRDVAPDNILITSGGRPVLIDFGSLSADLSRAGQEQRSSTVGLTKRFYTAPEQMSARARPTASADIYSMGAVVYRALCGVEPVDGQERIDSIFLSQKPDPYSPIAKMGLAGCSRAAADVIDKAMSMRPENRPADMASLSHNLWSSSRSPPPDPGPGPGPVPQTAFPVPVPAPPRSPVAWVLVAITALAIAGGLGYKWLDRNPVRSPDRPPVVDNSGNADRFGAGREGATSTADNNRPASEPPAATVPSIPPYVSAPIPRVADDPSPADTSDPQTESCTVTGLNPNGDNWLAVRAQPSLRSTWSSTRMGPGTVVSAFGQSGEWRHVRLVSGETGWANSRFLSCGAASEAVPPTPQARSKTCTVGGLDPKGNNWLALRRQPSFTSTWSSTRMGPGTVLKVIGRSSEWLNVQLDTGETGWANGKFVFCDN